MTVGKDGKERVKILKGTVEGSFSAPFIFLVVFKRWAVTPEACLGIFFSWPAWWENGDRITIV
jgi:hypothetical protein